jgi:hypothetical protein
MKSLPIVNCRVPIENIRETYEYGAMQQIGNWQSEIGNKLNV